MFDFLVKQEKDSLTLEKEQLERHLASLQKQSKELEKRIYGKSSREPQKIQKPTPKTEKIARFIPDEEIGITSHKNHSPQKATQLKFQKRITRNRVITLAAIALVLLILVIRTLF